MSWATPLFGSLNVIQTLFHCIENVSPDQNWELYGSKLVSKLPENAQKKIKCIEKIKESICNQANISNEKVELRLQERGIIEIHGHSHRSVLAISLQFLEAYQPPDLPSDDTPVENIQRKRFNDFIDKLPDNPEELSQMIEKMGLQDREDLANLVDKYFLALDEEEIAFIMRHEIFGHLKANDSVTTALASTLFGWGAFCAAEWANAFFPFSGSSYVWHATFYSLSFLSLQSVLSQSQERRADQAAFLQTRNFQGGIRFFKRVCAVNLLKKIQKLPEGTMPHFFQLMTNSEGESLFNFSHERAKTRLLNSQALRSKIK